MSSDMNQFMRRLRGMGIESRLSRGGHWQIRTPSGETIVCPKTPRNSSRTIKNTTAMLRRGGVVI